MNKKEVLPLPEELLERLEKTQQNPDYHAEGSVKVHTEMVLEKFNELQDEFDLNAEEKTILKWAAILHDVGKTLVTKRENGRWTSPGHEKAGVPIARDLLLQEHSITPGMRRRILELVRWHHVPLKWMKNNRSFSDFQFLSLQTDLRLLGIFSWFDFYGRICKDSSQVVAWLMEFNEKIAPRIAYEWGNWKALQGKYASWDWKMKNVAWNTVQMNRPDLFEKLLETEKPQEPAKNKIFLTMGAPLSGKSNFIEGQMKDAFHVKLEEYGLREEHLQDEFYLQRKLTEFRYFLSIYLRHHPVVVVEGRNLDDRLRIEITKILRDFPAEVTYAIFESPLAELKERNKAAAQPLEENELVRMYHLQQDPHPWEAHQLLWIS